mgnify:CR=1 FL=1
MNFFLFDFYHIYNTIPLFPFVYPNFVDLDTGMCILKKCQCFKKI